MNHFIALNWFRYLTSFLREKLCNRPGHYSITPKTLLLVSICCLGYQSQSKPHEWCLFASAAPADINIFPWLNSDETPYTEMICLLSLPSVFPRWSPSCGTRRPGCTAAQWRRWQESGGQWSDRIHHLNCLHTYTTPWSCCYQRNSRNTE